jgi:beta-N-acetylhexosaminidase
MTPTPIPLPAELPLRRRIAQLLNVGFRGCRPEECAPALRDVGELGVGAVIFFDQEMASPGAGRRNIESPAQVRGLISAFQASARIPLLVSVDQEGGRVNRLKPAYGFPPSVSHAELGQGDPEATAEEAGQTARTLVELGFNLNLAPVVDLDANPDNPIIRGKGRSFHADPEIVARHAARFVEAHRACGVLTCLKHFPGHGSARGDTHLGLVDVTRSWTRAELVPFQRLIQAGLCDVVMSAHVFNAALDPERPATLSRRVITGLLRDELAYDGVVTSDDMEMKAISSHYGLETAVPGALLAGVDQLCFGNNMSYDADIAPKVIALIEKAVREGRVPESRIDEACGRILRLKTRLVAPAGQGGAS